MTSQLDKLLAAQEKATRKNVIYGHIHSSTGADYWPLIHAREQMLNAGLRQLSSVS